MPCSQMISTNCSPPCASAAHSVGGVTRGEFPDPEQTKLHHRLGDPRFDQDEQRQSDEPPISMPITTGCAIRWCARHGVADPS